MESISTHSKKFLDIRSEIQETLKKISHEKDKLERFKTQNLL
jgi:hypothetical protein